MQSDIEVIDSSEKPIPNISGKYIESKHHDIHQIIDLGGNIFQYKGPKLDKETLKDRIEKSEELLKYKTEMEKAVSNAKTQEQIDAEKKRILEFNKSLKEFFAEIEAGKHLEGADFTFKTSDLGNKWFFAQITNIISSDENDTLTIGLAKRGILIGHIDENSLKLYKSTKCQDLTQEKRYGTVLRKDNDGNPFIEKISNPPSFKSFVTACINEISLDVGEDWKKLN